MERLWHAPSSSLFSLLRGLLRFLGFGFLFLAFPLPLFSFPAQLGASPPSLHFSSVPCMMRGRRLCTVRTKSGRFLSLKRSSFVRSSVLAMIDGDSSQKGKGGEERKRRKKGESLGGEILVPLFLLLLLLLLPHAVKDLGTTREKKDFWGGKRRTREKRRRKCRRQKEEKPLENPKRYVGWVPVGFSNHTGRTVL